MGNCIASSATLEGKQKPGIWSEGPVSGTETTPKTKRTSTSTSIGTPTTASINDAQESSSEQLEHGLRKYMTRELKDRDVNDIYELIEVLGVGSMGSVTLVRKKKEAIGGSARKYVRKYQGPSFRFRLRPSNSIRKNEMDREQRHHSLHSSSHLSVPSDRFYEVRYALKTIHLNQIADPAFIQELRNEIEVLKSLDHPNIVRAIETFEFKNQIGIVMELCSGGNLYTRDPYTEEQARHIVRNLTSAVAYMHRCGIIHRGR